MILPVLCARISSSKAERAYRYPTSKKGSFADPDPVGSGTIRSDTDLDPGPNK
jgi:hypothetical protein